MIHWFPHWPGKKPAHRAHPIDIPGQTALIALHVALPSRLWAGISRSDAWDEQGNKVSQRSTSFVAIPAS